MTKKCCMYNCKTNYRSEKRRKEEKNKILEGGGESSCLEETKTISVFRFPSQKTEPENRQRWIDTIRKVNANLEVRKETVICELHWPGNYEKVKKKGCWRPKNPPSVFIGIPQSITPQQPSKPRETTRTSNHERNTFPDELAEFDALDKVTFERLQDDVINNKKPLQVPITSFVCDNKLYLQSTSYFNGIPRFLVIISDSLKYEAFQLGVKFYINSLSMNRVTVINRWSTLEEVLRYLNVKEADEKMAVLKEQVAAMCCAPVGKKIYSPEIMMRAFEYFVTSRALYRRLKEDYKLPSIQTLTRLSSKVSKLSDANFMSRLFDSITQRQKESIILFDEVYVKKMMLYYGGTVFGSASNNPSLLSDYYSFGMLDHSCKNIIKYSY